MGIKWFQLVDAAGAVIVDLHVASIDVPYVAVLRDAVQTKYASTHLDKTAPDDLAVYANRADFVAKRPLGPADSIESLGSMTRTKRACEDESPLLLCSEKRARASTVERTRLSPPLSPKIRPEFTCESVCSAARTSIEEPLAAASSASLGTWCVGQILDGARVIYLTEDKSSWLYHAPGWYKRLYEAIHPHELSYSEWVDAVWDLHPMHHDAIKMFGKDVLMPRFQQAYGQSYRFSGKLFEAKPFPELLLHALTTMQRLVVHPVSRETYVRAGLVNWYEHGDHYMGPHSDDESNIHAHSPVFSLSLGATRRFVFTVRPMVVSAGGVARFEMMLNDGDLLVMGGTTQKTHKHALPKMKKCHDKRISVTLRCFK